MSQDVNCWICQAPAARYAEATVRQRHRCGVYECARCGFVFLDPVTWLPEAYACPINLGDIGYAGRNVAASSYLSKILKRIASDSDRFLDYGGGYGLLVRLMRDKGFRFHWYDPHCANLFAALCEAPPSAQPQYRALVAMEVFEHLYQPALTVADMVRFSRTLLFTTSLVPHPRPSPHEWAYFGLDHGQHVSFYTPAALRELGLKFGLEYRPLRESWHGAWHALCPPSDPLPSSGGPGRARFRRLFTRLWARVAPRSARPSLILADSRKVHDLIRQHGTGTVPKSVNLDDLP